jgi:antitoxin component YwqK of YwqJK toxin-antitoxin module
MRRLVYTFLVLFAVFTYRSQTFELVGKDTINRTDAEGKKQGKWIVFGKSKLGMCYQPDQKVEEGKYQDNRKTGNWMEYHCNGNLKSKIMFVNGRADGYCQIFHENGKISEEGIWKNMRWVGKYKLFYDNGQVQHEFAFNEFGKRDGPQKYYHENGQVAIEGNFDNGKESGLIKEYYENGDIKAEKTYNDGAVDVAAIKEYEPKKPIAKRSEDPLENAPVVRVKEDEKPNEAVLKSVPKGPMILNGQFTLFNKNKQISKDGVFKDNRFMDGKAYFYDENGILQRVAVYRNGVYVGDTPVDN